MNSLKDHHTFYIPVMGTGFTIDTPIKIAKYGISSAISLVDDVLIEQIRKYYSEKENLPYTVISNKDPDARAKRIEQYLNLVSKIVKRDFQKLKESSFLKGSEIVRYFEMLPDDSILKADYQKMLLSKGKNEREQLQNDLREKITVGSIDVNIMAKLNRTTYSGQEALGAEFCDALAALRGYAKSNLSSAVIFSAGMNAKLYSYLNNFQDFFWNGDEGPTKKIILKVSDYRSALVQGKILAKKGLWVHEFRIESSINCGGHAFFSSGPLMGPVLEEFKEKKEQLVEELSKHYYQALESKSLNQPSKFLQIRITAQGGIGTASEDRLLRNYYNLDATGWGTPFLLVPEVTNVDDVHLQKLSSAKDDDVELSDNSPLGILIWNLRNSESEKNRIAQNKEGKLGTPCVKGYLQTSTEFTDKPLCLASATYKKKKLKKLIENKEKLPEEKLNKLINELLCKSCICNELGSGVLIKYGISQKFKSFVCCGPNIVNFSKISKLEEMIDHIYDRHSLMDNKERPHMFIKEMMLYLEQLKKELSGISEISPKYFQELQNNLFNGVECYQKLADKLSDENKEKFLNELQKLSKEIDDFLRSLDLLDIPVEASKSLQLN